MLGLASLETNNLTQLLWKKTKRLGVGMAKTVTGFFVIVANYYPPGNVTGEFLDNVLHANNAEYVKDIVRPIEPPMISKEHIIDDEFTQIEIDFAAAHNDYRRDHGVPMLFLSKKLCQLAQERANVSLKLSL